MDGKSDSNNRSPIPVPAAGNTRRESHPQRNPALTLPPLSLDSVSTTIFGMLSVFPIEVIFEILLKCPVKTLVKIMCVSKSLLSFISSPQFSKTHLRLSADPQFTHYRLLSIKNWRHRLESHYKAIFHSYPLYESMYQLSSEFITTFIDETYSIIGSCDGLILISKSIHGYDTLFLWNPSIVKLKELPSSGKIVPSSLRSRFACGFGYSECQSDYKIVEIVGNKNIGYRITDVSVYSLRSNSWRRIQEYPSVDSLTEPGKFVKGKLHWIPSGAGVCRNAIWFDLEDEKFGNVALPEQNGGVFKKLVSSAGNLCVTCYYSIKTDVWIMKKYGLAESWTKVISVPQFVDKPVWPIFITPSDEILLQDYLGSVVWWNVSRYGDIFERSENQNDTFVRLENGSRWNERTELNLYVVSLVWPFFWRKSEDAMDR